MSFEKNQNINGQEKESAKKKHTIVIANVDIEQQARDIAAERLTSSKTELKGFTGFFRRIWKHNLAHEYYRQKEIAKARREIKESGNVYAGENGSKADHEAAMNAVIDRFVFSWKEDVGLLRSGEDMKKLQESKKEENSFSNEINELIKRFASDSINEAQFRSEKDKLLHGKLGNISDKRGNAFVENNSIYADNLLEIAKQVKANVTHGKGLDSLDDEFEIVIGNARHGVETKAQYNAVDRITEKIQKSFVGSFVNEATVASAVAIAYGAIAKGATSGAQKAAKLVGPAGMALSAGVGGAIAGVRENKRLKEDREQHAREMAKGGKKIENGSDQRMEMEKYRHETKGANELAANLKNALENLKKQPNEAALSQVLENFNEIAARVNFGEKEKIDLISFSDSKVVEQERMAMYRAAVEAKIFLKDNIKKSWSTFYGNEKEFDEFLRHGQQSKIEQVFKKEKQFKDEAFDRMKNKQVAWAVAKGMGIGLGVGIAAQEIQAHFGGDSVGLLEKEQKNVGTQHLTSLEYLRRYVSGELPNNPNGNHGAFVNSKDFAENHREMFSHIKRDAWADNNTAKFDRNELKLWWGGKEGTGIDSSGNYVFNVKHMSSDGSFHGDKKWDPQELMREGKMKMLLSLSKDTQNQVVEIPIDANGNAIIDPNSEIGKIAFKNIDGHAKFIGRLAEVAVMGGNDGKAEHVNILATHVGQGIKGIVALPGKNGVELDLPYVIPIALRHPLEKLEKMESTKQQGIKAKETFIPEEVINNDIPGTVHIPREAIKKTAVGDWENFTSEYAQARKNQGSDIEPNDLQSSVGNAPENIAVQLESSTDHPVRALAWHTISKLEQSEDFKYADLNAKTEEERNQKFNEITRHLWDEITVHGMFNKGADGKWQLMQRSDLDGESCLKLLELAGIQIDRNKINFVANGDGADSGLVLDTSNKHGVIAEDGGRMVTSDHHGERSGRGTSATKFLYLALVDVGLLERQDYLDKYVDFVTKDDNKNFTDAEYKTIFKNYHCNLYGINRKLTVDEIFDLIKNNQNPMEAISKEYLESHTYYNVATKKEETLAQLSENMLKKIIQAKQDIARMEKQGFVVDTGNAYGKVLIDVKMLKADGKYQPRISGNAGGPIAAFARGFDAYISWSPEENSFALFTKRRMPKDFLPQGRNTRGNMWTKNERDGEVLKVKLEDILAKLSEKPFAIEGKLKEALEEAEKKNLDQAQKNSESAEAERKEKEKQEKIAVSVGKMTNLLSDFKLSHETVKEESKKIGVKPADIALQFIQKRPELLSKYEAKFNTIPDDKRDEMAIEKLAMTIILEDEKEKIKEEIKKIDAKIDITTNADELKVLNDEKVILENKRSNIGVDYLRVARGVKQQNQPSVPDKFTENQFVKEISAKSPELLKKIKDQMDAQRIPIEAQLNFIEVVAKADLPNDLAEALFSSDLEFRIKLQSKFLDKIDTIELTSDNKIRVYFGVDDFKKSPVDELVKDLRIRLRSM